MYLNLENPKDTNGFLYIILNFSNSFHIGGFMINVIISNFNRMKPVQDMLNLV